MNKSEIIKLKSNASIKSKTLNHLYPSERKKKSELFLKIEKNGVF